MEPDKSSLSKSSLPQKSSKLPSCGNIIDFKPPYPTPSSGPYKAIYDRRIDLTFVGRVAR